MSDQNIDTRPPYNEERVGAVRKVLAEMDSPDLTAVAIEVIFLLRQKTAEEVMTSVQALVKAAEKGINENQANPNNA